MEEFIRRFLQHALPKGFVKVRYYGFFSPGLRARLACLREQLGRQQPNETSIGRESQASDQQTDSVLCPTCGQVMHKQKSIPPNERKPP
ncbi:MAG: transposase [Anaerolineaceae bacterium]|nr:transposase [Anaerolineaceae bacterium]